MEKVHFRLTSVAQKSCCLSSLWPLWFIHQNIRIQHIFSGLPAQLRCFLHSNPTKPPPIQASGDQRMDRNPFFNLRRGSHRIKGLRTRLKSNYHIARLSRVITVNYLIFTFSNCSWWFVQVSNSFFSSSSYALVCFLWMNLFSRKYSSGASLYKTAVIIKQKVKSHRKNQVILITWIK